jgi:hypothetical protein
MDLLGTRRLYESELPVESQAKSIFRDLVQELDGKFCDHFTTQEIEHTFDVSIFGDSLVIVPRRKDSDIVRRLVDFLLDYQGSLLFKHGSPSRAILTRDAFFSLKVPRASKQSILGSEYTSISLCGGRGIGCMHNWLEGLPIGVYMARRMEPELTAEQRARIVPVKHIDGYADLCFIRRAEAIDPFLPPTTCDLLREKPGAGREAIMHSIRAAFENQCPSDKWAWFDRLRPWAYLKTAFRDEETWDRWGPWVLVHLGKQHEVVRSSKPSRGTRQGTAPTFDASEQLA